MIQTRIATGVTRGASDPATGFKGKLFFNTSSDVLKVHDGSNWNVLDTGTADLVGPGSATDNAIVRFDGTTGKLCQNSVVTIADTTGAIAGGQSIALSGSSSGAVTIQTAAAAGTWALTLPTNDGDSGQFLQTNGSGVTSWQTVTAGIGGSTGATDNALLRADGAGGATLQAGVAVTLSDAGVIQLGGTSSGFTGLKVSPFTDTHAAIRKADDSGYGDLDAQSLNCMNLTPDRIGYVGVLAGAMEVKLSANGLISFTDSNNSAFTTVDTGMSRNAAGVVEINNGTAGQSGVLLLRARAFAALPASPVAGMLATVNNSTTATLGATIAGGGANFVLALYNGTNWVVA